MVIVDTNVLVDVLEDDPDWAEWSTGRVRELSKIHDLAINPVIYAELSLTFDAIEELDAVVYYMDLKFMEIPRPALFLLARRSSAIANRAARRPTFYRISSLGLRQQ